MGDVLTQSQIDALLNSVQQSGNFDAPADKGGAADAGAGAGATAIAAEQDKDKKYRKYNFHTPKKFTKDRLKLLRSVYENYARLISSHLTSFLRIGCEIELFEIEEQRYYEFNNALGEESLLAFINVDIEEDGVEEDPVLLVMSNSVMYTMLDRMLGGTGEPDGESDGTDQGGYTDIEVAVYETVLEHIAPIMSDVWQNYLGIAFKFHKLEPNPNLIQVISIDEIVVIITFNVAVRDTQGQMSICLPGSILDKVFKHFEQTSIAGSRKKDSQTNNEKQNIIKGIENSVLEVKAEFDKSNILLEELYSMNVGDVLNLNLPKGSEINVNIGNKPWFKGKLGIYKDNVAVRLTGLHNEQ
ncbi:MAG: FliM/FliN family flagellar motor switch protein [Clostridiales bacterium]|nr:FliM/FliN family flagellar motor switch protein [Clostridiales bacterium]